MSTSPTPVDPRTPVIVGVGQYLNRTSSLDDAREPAALIEEAVRVAATDAGLSGPPSADLLRVVRQYSCRYGNLPRVVADRLGIDPRLQYTTDGGNTPQSLVNRTALEILRGDVGIAILAGGEAFRTRMRARREGVELDWPVDEHGGEPGDDPEQVGGELNMISDAEQARSIGMPVQMYPMFETALRAASGRSVEEHRNFLGTLWSSLSEVAARNPHAWIREAKTPAEITEVSARNRMIGLPYPKLMNSNNDVDMAAAVIMCSAQAAQELGVPRDRWVFPHSGADCHEHTFVSIRDRFDRTPAIEIGGSEALRLAGIGIDDVSVIDLYSCFPSAVQLGAASLGIDLTDPSRQWSRTGGLSFAGGPWNNYVMHAIATVVSDLRDRPGERGLVWGNGGLATKHSFGVYSTEPPDAPFGHAEPQDEIDALPRRSLATPPEAAGRATIEGYTVMFDREGVPERSIASCLLDDGRRAWGTSTSPDVTAAMCEGEWVGQSIELDASGDLHTG